MNQKEMAKKICEREKSLGRELNISDAARAVRHFLDVIAEDPDGLATTEKWVKERRGRKPRNGRKQ